jgi:hypothetical protein
LRELPQAICAFTNRWTQAIESLSGFKTELLARRRRVGMSPLPTQGDLPTLPTYVQRLIYSAWMSGVAEFLLYDINWNWMASVLPEQNVFARL